MKFAQSAQIPVAREPLWDFLMDVPKVAKSLPGVESVTKIDDTTYEAPWWCALVRLNSIFKER
jgi:carbon monoxide dehydrogenase subunit G